MMDVRKPGAIANHRPTSRVLPSLRRRQRRQMAARRPAAVDRAAHDRVVVMGYNTGKRAEMTKETCSKDPVGCSVSKAGF
jgi:hypothetical protein